MNVRNRDLKLKELKVVFEAEQQDESALVFTEYYSDFFGFVFIHVYSNSALNKNSNRIEHYKLVVVVVF